MSDVYKLTQKSVWTNDIGRYTTWYLLDERGKGFYINHIVWTMRFGQEPIEPDSECMAFRYDGKKDCVTSWSEVDTVLGMEPQEAFETVCEHLGIKVRYL
jgi:hypothetical protein